MFGKGILAPVFRMFMACDIPSNYKIFLTTYLFSYAFGGAYISVFTVSAITRLLDSEEELDTISAFTPAGIIILNFVVYYVLGYITFIISILRMYYINNKLLLAKYRKNYGGAGYLIFVQLRYCLVIQSLFYNVACFTF
jgi:hypothetical protein